MKFPVLILILVAVFTSCKSVLTESGEKVPIFKGTIIYDVEIDQVSETKFTGNLLDKYGKEMHLTVFRNGDIQRKFIGAADVGYDLQYIKLDENIVVEKFNGSDSLYVHSASKPDMIKLNDLRKSKEKVKVLDRELNRVAIAAQESTTQLAKGNYLSINYWYDETLKIDKTKYTNVNDELLSYFLQESNGSLYLKYELDYYTHKITFTAKEILPGKYEKEDEKLDPEMPRISE